MNFLDLLIDSGAGDSLRELGTSLGLGGDETKKLVSALEPAMTRSLQHQGETTGGLKALHDALANGGHSKYIEQPELMQAAASVADGNKILGHLFGSKDVSRNVAAQAAMDTGIDAGTIKKALPLVAGLAMGALGKASGPESAPESDDGLGRLLGGLLGGGSNGGVDVGDLLGLARKVF